MTVDTATRVRAAALPHVNLLPPEIGEQKRLVRVEAGAGLGLLLAIAAIAALYVQGTHSVTSAKQKLAAANSQNARLSAQISKFGDVNTTQAALNANEAMLTQAMSSEIRCSDLLGDFGTLPTSTWLQSLTLTESVVPGSLASPTGAPPVVGTVSFKGVGDKYASLADWLDKVTTIGTSAGLANVSFSTAQEQFIDAHKVVDFQAATSLTSAALSGRCAKPGAC
jgi:Tfp pilus assembly protein PilN